MASITSTGIGSGLDVNSIVTQLMAVESRPLALLQQSASAINTKLSAFGKLQSLTSTMRDAANALTSVTLWNQTSASSTNSAAVAASAAGGAAVGSYSVSVQSLAAPQTVSSTPFASSSATVGEGTLTIELGSWVADGSSTTDFAPNSGAGAVTITIGPEDTSLAAIRDRINASKAGVSATIVNDAGGARLALRSTTTGAENAFRITGSDALAAFSFDATAADTPMVLNQSAKNASATINGIAVSSATNKLEGVADGLTLTLQQVTTSPVDVGVAANGDAVKTAVNAFVSAFNALAANVREQTKYDATSKTAGTLQGDRTAVSLLSQLRAVINQPSGAGGAYSVLSDAGIAMQSDGTLAVNATKLDAAVANRGDLRKLLAADGATAADSGFMTRFRQLGSALLNTDGSFDSHTDSLQAMLKRNNESQSAIQQRLTQTEARLRAQYQALDTNMASLSSLSSYMTGQLAALAK